MKRHSSRVGIHHRLCAWAVSAWALTDLLSRASKKRSTWCRRLVTIHGDSTTADATSPPSVPSSAPRRPYQTIRPDADHRQQDPGLRLGERRQSDQGASRQRLPVHQRPDRQQRERRVDRIGLAEMRDVVGGGRVQRVGGGDPECDARSEPPDQEINGAATTGWKTMPGNLMRNV